MKAKWILLGALASLAAWFGGVGKWIKDKNMLAAKQDLAEQLKAKVAALKVAKAERKEKTDAAVAQVDEAAALDRAKDPVAFANDLILSGGNDPVTKG